MPLYYQNEKLFSEIYLEEITAQPEREEVLASLRVLREYRDYAETDNLNAWVTSYIHEVLAALGFNPVFKTDALTLLNPMGTLDQPVSLCYVTLPKEDLDNTAMGRNWAEKVIRSLREQEMQWGLLTNGKLWRIYHLDEPMPYETYFEIDLDTILTNQAQKAYQIFHKFMKAENFVVDEERQSQFDRFKQESKDKVDYIENELQNALKQREEGGQGVLSDICMGYVDELRNAGEVNLDDEDMRQKIYHGAMLYMFRLLFLFYADARGLLSDNNHELLQQAANKTNSHQGVETTSEPFSLWKLLEEIFVDIDQTYNGGLFSPQESEFTQFIEETRIKDQYLASVFYNLTTYTEKDGKEHLISYRDMGVRHLGTLYEGLLEHKLFITSEDTEVKVTKGKVSFIPVSKGGKLVLGQYLPAGSVYFAGDPYERKSSGSFFTPEDVVVYIVQNTVGEKLKERKESFFREQKDNLDAYKYAINETERFSIAGLLEESLLNFVRQRMLNLSIIDPAMGSGHFLVYATNFISNSITDILNEIGLEGKTNTETSYWRRWVVESCIYGVDINPLAVELAKLSLWILSMRKDSPLSFLNHHIKCGNSLEGAWIDDFGNYPGNSKKIPRNQISLFRSNQQFTNDIETAIQSSSKIKSFGSSSLDDIRTKKNWLEDIDQLLQDYKTIGNIHTHLLIDRFIDENQYLEIIETRNFNPLPTTTKGYFHWEMEFPEIFFHEGGFDIVIGNPPYVRCSPNPIQKRFFTTSNGANLFAWFIELSMKITNNSSSIGMIVPLSLMISRQMEDVRTLFLESSGSYKFANFDNIPDCIFNSGKVSLNTNTANSQRTTIFLINRDFNGKKYLTTDLLRWQTSERSYLFENLSFADISSIVKKEHFPMVGDTQLVPFLKQLQSSGRTIQSLLEKPSRQADKYSLFVPTRARYFIPASPEDFKRNNQMTLNFSSEENYNLAFILISSNVFYWFWRAHGDGFDVAKRDVYNFPLPTLQQSKDEISNLAKMLHDVIPECRVFKKNSGKLIPNINFNNRIDVLMLIDEYICRKLGFEDNFDIGIFAQKKSNSFMQQYDLLDVDFQE